MKRFTFPLRPVAVLRSHREARAREIFAQALQARAAAASALARVRERVAALERELSQGRAGTFHAATEAERLLNHRRECALEVEAERTLAAADTAAEQRRTEYLEAHRQLEVVRRLETKARTMHRLATAREEQAEFDERATRRAGLAAAQRRLERAALLPSRS
jgi:flagellar FliJ protein